MNVPIIFPDTVGIVIDYLRYELALRSDPATICSMIPPSRPTRMVTVRRVGGIQQTVVSDAASIAIECWAPHEQDARDLAAICRALIHAMAGTIQAGVPIYRIEDFAGPGDLADPDTATPRTVFTVSIAVRGMSEGHPTSA